jgi:hypothetical protein
MSAPISTFFEDSLRSGFQPGPLMTALQSGRQILGTGREGDEVLRSVRMRSRAVSLEERVLLMAIAFLASTHEPVTMRRLRHYSQLDLKDVRLAAVSLMNRGLIAVTNGSLLLRLPPWNEDDYDTTGVQLK